jgi:uncharacterized protein (TIGR03435 family)
MALAQYGPSVILLAATSVFGQNPGAPVAVETATIRPTSPGFAGSTVERGRGGAFSASGLPMKSVIAYAYNVHVNQVSGGPAWLGSDRYDVVAKARGVPGELSIDAARAMLRALLDERLKLRVRRDLSEMPAYMISMTQGFPKLTLRTDDDDEGADLEIQPGYKLAAKNATIADLASVLQQQTVDRPVLDQTALTPRFDFDLSWKQGGGAEAEFRELSAAMRQQLGLEIEGRRVLADVIVIEQVERPSN